MPERGGGGALACCIPFVVLHGGQSHVYPCSKKKHNIKTGQVLQYSLFKLELSLVFFTPVCPTFIQVYPHEKRKDDNGHTRKKENVLNKNGQDSQQFFFFFQRKFGFLALIITLGRFSLFFFSLFLSRISFDFFLFFYLGLFSFPSLAVVSEL